MLEQIGGKFDQKQFGGLKGRSTTHALVDIVHKWQQAVDDQKSVRIVFVDYAKAFDHVDHLTVMTKLAALGVRPIILRWLQSLTERQQRVMTNIGIFWDWVSPNEGMPQVTWLEPHVFLTLINDLSSTMELHKFVDDCTLSEIIARHETSAMQSEMDSLAKWSGNNLMNVNIKKTKEMLLGSIGKPHRHLSNLLARRLTGFTRISCSVCMSVIHLNETITYRRYAPEPPLVSIS